MGTPDVEPGASARARPASLPSAADLAELVRLPAVLSVPGDGLLGAAAAGRLRDRRTAPLIGSSASLYLAGMALNDWADREVDARERPHRPIPSGRVAPPVALGLAGALTAVGLGLAAAAGGARSLRVALPLAATVWGYDLAAKDSPAGPAAMAAARGLDVLLGASTGRLRDAARPAAVVAAHTAVVSLVSRREVEGAEAALPRAAATATAAIATVAAALPAPAAPVGAGTRAVRTALLAVYGAVVGGGYGRAAAEPTPALLQRAVGTAVVGLVPLQGALTAGQGAPLAGAGIAAALPVARRLARRKGVT